jgi:protein-tyrosine phosphatase
MGSSTDLILKSVLNFRDVGAVVSADGKPIMKGLVFRSANVDKISRQDINKLHKLGIKTIIDFRAPSERKKNFSRIENIERISIVMDFDKVTREKLKPYLLQKNSENRIADISNSLYIEMLDASLPAVKQVHEILLSPERCPILIHCQAGKDRTGILSAVIQLAMRADRQSIIEDYLKSNEALMPFFKRTLLIRKIVSFGFFPYKNLLFAITVRQRNIESVLDRINSHFGGIEAFLESSGFEAGNLEILRERLISK